MFSLPTMLTVPSVAYFNSAGLDFSNVAVYLAVFLVAALLASAFGILRAHHDSAPRATEGRRLTLTPTTHPADAAHNVAA
jgi:hypothetical protein